MDKVVHFEIPAENVKRAQDFYRKAFGWKINPVEQVKYTILQTVDVDKDMMPLESGAINGGMMERNDKVKSPVITVQVAGIDKSAEEIKKLGGTVIWDKFQVGDIGFAAYFKDTEGNVLGLWENAKK